MCKWAIDMLALNAKVPAQKSNNIYVAEGNIWYASDYERDIEEHSQKIYEQSPHYRQKQGWIQQGKLL